MRTSGEAPSKQPGERVPLDLHRTTRMVASWRLEARPGTPREEKVYVYGATSPPDRLLRAGLRVLVVALAPFRPRPRARLHTRLRAVRRGARRAGPHQREGQHRRAVEADGALAGRCGVGCGRCRCPGGGPPLRR